MDQREGVWRLGAVVWREAASADLDRTTAFYGELLGWKHHDSPMGENGVYRHFQAGGRDVAGGWQLGKDMAGVPSHWIHYLSVADVDAATAAAKSRGAQVRMGPLDIPNVGRATYLADPQGASVALFRDAKGDMPGFDPTKAVLGEFCWETLNTTDPAAAVRFYTAVAGQHVSDFQGSQVLGTGPGERDGVADVQKAPPGVPSHWISHVVIDDLAASRDRATRLGAKVLMAEIEVPTVGKMAVIQDPVGAYISLFQAAPRA
jgi:predicted enzyme related to lactoylglutathione lyase